MPGKVLLLALVAVLVFGCSAGESLKEKIKEGKFDAASEVYNENAGYFRKEGEKFAVELATLARTLKARQEPALSKALERLEPVKWPAAKRDWPELKADMTSALDALDGYKKHRILLDPKYSSDLYRRLDDRYAMLHRGMERDAPKLFADHDPFAKQRFFDAYPIAFEIKIFLGRHYRTIRPRLAAAKADQLRAFLAAYPAGLDLPDRQYGDLSDLYLARRADALANGHPPAFHVYLEALEEARRAGFAPDGKSGYRVAVVRLGDGTAGADANRRFSLKLISDMPFALDTAGGGDPLRAASAKSDDGADYVVIVRVDAARASHKAVEVTSHPSRYLSGYRHDPNPAYDDAERAARRTEGDLSLATVRLAGSEPIAAIEAKIAAAKQAKDEVRVKLLTSDLTVRQVLERNYAEAKAAVDAAYQTLSATPRTIETPTYADYTYKRSRVAATKSLELTYWVVDKPADRILRLSLRRSASADFNTVSGVHGADQGRDAILGSADSAATVASWERAPLEVSLSDLCHQFVVSRESARRIAGLSDLRKDIAGGS